ncbi:hypothetical protein SLEP1_g13810 [Rubroshorea leprosula]|uniref:Uncharacterized protein n=1 Tax=Rubroshorea leprosula TaxID=152421 RepID=A0AAV5IN15_9ROSI|nr:hypothetical protein SLEP1_g13810 [Rubroshorea leprosula]
MYPNNSMYPIALRPSSWLILSQTMSKTPSNTTRMSTRWD